MFETKVEWEACVGESRLQLSIFSRCAVITGKFCYSGWDSNSVAWRQTQKDAEGPFFFAGGTKACIVEVNC